MIYESVYSIDSVCVWQNLGSGEHVLYSLYGIVEHSGSMRGGHYAAYVKVRTPQRKPEAAPEPVRYKAAQAAYSFHVLVSAFLCCWF